MLSFLELNIARVSTQFINKIKLKKFNKAMKDWKKYQKKITFYMIE